MLHHYLQKGYSHDFILDLTETEKIFYKASMEVKLEDEAEKLKLFLPSS